MLIREDSDEMTLTPSAGWSVSVERVMVLHCASTRVNEEVRRNSIVEISRVIVETAEVVNTAVLPAMELTVFFVPDTPVTVRVDDTEMATDSAM